MKGKRSAELAKLQLLNAELTLQRDIVSDRTKSIETKSSYLALGATVIAGISFTKLAASEIWLLGLLPSLLALGTIALCTIALWPRKTSGVTARGLTNRWLGSNEKLIELEDYLLELRTAEIEERLSANRSRMHALKWAFVLAISSVAAILPSALVNGFLSNGETGSKEAETSIECTPGCCRLTEIDNRFGRITIDIEEFK